MTNGASFRISLRKIHSKLHSEFHFEKPNKVRERELNTANTEFLWLRRSVRTKTNGRPSRFADESFKLKLEFKSHRNQSKDELINNKDQPPTINWWIRPRHTLFWDCCKTMFEWALNAASSDGLGVLYAIHDVHEDDAEMQNRVCGDVNNPEDSRNRFGLKRNSIKMK